MLFIHHILLDAVILTHAETNMSIQLVRGRILVCVCFSADTFFISI